ILKPFVTGRPDPSVHCERHPNFRRHANIDASKPWRRHPDNGEGATVQGNRVANDVAVAPEFFPKLVTKHGHGMSVRCAVFLRQKSATEKWLQLEQVEIISGYLLNKESVSIAAHAYFDSDTT